jgi:hypothetical protein
MLQELFPPLPVPSALPVIEVATIPNSDNETSALPIETFSLIPFSVKNKSIL